MRASNHPTPRVYVARGTRAALSALGFMALVLAGCTQRPAGNAQRDQQGWKPASTTRVGTRVNDAQRDQATSTLPRIDAIMGQPIAVLLPVEELRTSMANQGQFAILQDDGTRLRFTRYDVFVTPANSSADKPADADAARMARWLGPRWEWTTREATAPTPAPTPATAPATPSPIAGLLLIEPPLSSASPALWIGSQRVPVQWLPSNLTLAQDNAMGWSTPSLPVWANASPVATTLLRQEAAHPLLRWRVRLTLDGLRGQNDPAVGAVGAAGEVLAGEAFAGPLEALAQQHEQRWRVALARLHKTQPELAQRLAQRLAMFVRVRQGLPVPAWEQDLAKLEQLLDDLLNTQLSPQRRAEYAEAFVRQQPAGAAWVTDDGGLLVRKPAGDNGTGNDAAQRADVPDEPRVPWASVALANLHHRSSAATLWGAWDTRAPEPAALASGEVLLLTMPLAPGVSAREARGELQPADAPGPFAATGVGGVAGRFAELQASVGAWSGQRAVLAGTLPARAPGLATGPFQRDLTMREWLEGEAASDAIDTRSPDPSTPDPSGQDDDQSWATAALLQRVRTPQPGMLKERSWELFIESLVAPSSVWDANSDAIFIFVGAPGAPRAAWRVARDGMITNMVGDANVQDELDPLPRAIVTELGDRWTARVPLPLGAIEEDGLIRLGLARIDPRGVRSCWPRAIVPWQGEPSRAAVDSNSW